LQWVLKDGISLDVALRQLMVLKFIYLVVFRSFDIHFKTVSMKALNNYGTVQTMQILIETQ
jgi:hypothetical protein